MFAPKKIKENEEKESKWDLIYWNLYFKFYSYRYYFPFRQIGAVKWFIHNLIWPKQKWMMNGISRSWNDKTYVIPTVLFNAIVDFVEKERCFEVIDWEGSGESHAEAAIFIKDCYDYIKFRRPTLRKEIDRVLSEGAEGWELNKPDGKSYEDRYPNLTELEERLTKDDQFYMIGIVKNVDYLWT